MNKVSENPFKNREEADMPLIVVTAIFVTCYLVANLMAVKVIGILNFFYFDAGTLTFPLAYMLGDVMTEIWGYRTTRKIIFLTFFCNVLMVIFTQIGVWLPSPEYMDETATAYNIIFNYVPRIILGSLTGFLLGELSNSWIMERIKYKTEGKHLWVRTIGSSVIGYFFDTVPFVLIAFAGVMTTRDILLMIGLQYLMKLGIESLFGTPLTYAAISLLKKIKL